VQAFEELLIRCYPGCRVLSRRPLGGGISAQASWFELELDGRHQEVVVRRPGVLGAGGGTQRAACEFRVLALARAAGIAVPRPRFLEDSTGTLVLDYVTGELEFAPHDLNRSLRRLAEELIKIHGITAGSTELSFLSSRELSAARNIENQPLVLDESLGEAALRAALRRLWPWPARNPPVLLHGDYWPGNVVWGDGVIRAVLDWEEAELGDPLADVALTRLDLAWAFGARAMHEFTEHYRSLSDLDWKYLPHWDLCIALRPMAQLPRWASAYRSPAIGRPDIDEAALRDGHRQFVARALASLQP
jgi:aminoglycoside phosphotransferase (APT) family kinase protein